MTEIDSSQVEIVRGEMQPWSDGTLPGMPPADGAVICKLLQDLVPHSRRALVVGPHGRDVIELVASRSDHVTVLLRSLSDAAEMSSAVEANVQVVAGALDGLADRADDQYDAVIAIDGLDRVLGADSPNLSWPERFGLLLKRAAAGAALVVSLENGFSLTSLLDRRGTDERHGDNEWWPLRDDPLRPGSIEEFSQAADRAGVSGAVVYAAFHTDGGAHTLIDVRTAAAARPETLIARLGVRGLEASARSLPLLAPVRESARAAARAGLLASLSQTWLLVRGAPTSAAYAEGTTAGLVLTVAPGVGADPVWLVQVSGSPAGAELSAGLAVDPTGIAARLPDMATVEDLLFRLIAIGDVPAIRAVCAKLGEWVRTQQGSAPAGVLCFDDVLSDGSSFTRGVYGWTRSEPASSAELLAAAWYRLCERLVGARRRHPWPPWMSVDDLVGVLMRMASEEPTPETLRRGKESADALRAAIDGPVDAEVDVRSVLEEAQELRKQVEELNGHIFGLERTIGWRDKQLKVRENRIRQLRSSVRAVDTVRNHRAFRLLRYAAKIRKPKQFARAVVRRLRG